MAKVLNSTSGAKANWPIINISLANDGEGRRVFVGGMEEGDMLIERGKDVAVPPGVVDRLNDAVIGVAEPDPDNPDKMLVIDRQRYAFSIKGRVVA